MTKIIGWSHTPFGKLDLSLSDLVDTVTRGAIEHAGLEPGDVDEVFLATYNGGLQALTFPSGLPGSAFETLVHAPATRVENACATGSTAVHQAVRSVESGRARTVLVVGAEKMTDSPPSTVGRALLGADPDLAGSESAVGFAELFAEVARAYRARYGLDDTTLGIIASKAHRAAMDNPYAHFHKELSWEFCSTTSEANPMVAEPLRRSDCSPISDGAAALVVAADDVSPGADGEVVIRGIGHASDALYRSQRSLLEFAGAEKAWQAAFADANLSGPRDLDLIELHDCFTIAELQLYEVLGLAPRGQGDRVLLDGLVYPEGALPVNRSGGLKAKGHPIGATGVSQHVVVAAQLTGSAGAMQLPSPSRGAVFNMGGLAVANFATILEATR